MDCIGEVEAKPMEILKAGNWERQQGFSQPKEEESGKRLIKFSQWVCSGTEASIQDSRENLRGELNVVGEKKWVGRKEEGQVCRKRFSKRKPHFKVEMWL